MSRITQPGCGGGPAPPFLALLVVAAALVGEVSAASFPLRWRWSNPRPHGNNVVDMAYSSTLGLAVQVAEYGQLYTSVDLELWTPRESGTTNWLRAVTFMGSRILITGECGVVRYADSVSDIRSGELVDGATDDWLEAVCATVGLAVAVGDEGAIYTSTNGISWKRQPSPEASPHWLRGVATGNGQFVAVGEGGTILTSPNGTNWTKRTSGTTAHLNRVAFGYNTFTAVGDSGVALISTDGGSSWQPVSPNPGANGSLYFAAYGGTDQVLVGRNEVRVSDNGVWWDELAKTNGPPVWTYYSAIGRRGFFFLAGQTGMMAEGYQPAYDPYFWLETAESVRTILFDVFWATNLFVAVGDRATVMTSDSGVDWTPELVPTNLMSTVFLGVGGTTNLLVAAGNQGGLMTSTNGWTNIVVTNLSGGLVTQTVSTLGVFWQAVEPRPTTNDLQGVAWFKGQYVVCGDLGSVFSSPDGVRWTGHATPTTKLLSGLAASADALVATGDDGALLVSADATNWTALDSQTTNWLYRVRYLNGGFVATGQNGALLTSPDGSNWTPRVSGSSAWFYDVTWLDGTYFAVGAQGRLLTSGDGVSWTERQTITRKTLQAVAADTHYLIAAGLEGVILRSPIVPDLTPIEILEYSHLLSTNQVVWRNLYLFAGKPDQRFTVDRCPGLATNSWVAGPPVEIFDSSGTLYYLETVPADEAPRQEFYRATLVP